MTISKKRIVTMLILIFLLSTFSSNAFATNDSIDLLSDSPSITIEAIDQNGNIAVGTTVYITALTGGKSEIVLKEVIGESGKIQFKSIIPYEILQQAPGDVADMVYEILLISPDGEVKKEIISVQHPKNIQTLSVNDRMVLESDSLKEVKIQFTGDTLDKVVPPQTNNDNKLANSSSDNCYYNGSATLCIVEEQYYTRPTKIGTVNVASGERVDFNLTSSAKVKLDIGYKSSPTSTWSVNGNVSLTSDVSTGVDYIVDGQCRIFWGTLECNLNRDLYANYEFRYTKTDWYNDLGYYMFTTYEVVPTRLIGSTNQETWNYLSQNGQSVADVTNNRYGAYFVITSRASTTKSYSAEQTFSIGFDVPTPVGTFSAKSETSYRTSHTIKWSTTSSSLTFYHYDWDNTGKMYYVTY